MNDKVLTEDEKNALLEGVQSGEVEVQSSDGQIYASVTPFEIGPRSRIVKDSFPRLQLLDQQVAGMLSKSATHLLQCEVQVVPGSILIRNYGELREQLAGLSAVTTFDVPPLNGKALIVMEPGMVRHLVDTFFGGIGNDTDSDHRGEFTPGEMSIARLFATVILGTIKEVWASTANISPENVETEVTIDAVDIVAESDPVLCTEFQVSTSEKDGAFRILWPTETIKPLMPVFEGQKKDRDRADDNRWKVAISRTVADAVISLTANVGNTQTKLGSLVSLSPGDVIDIDDPQRATLMAKDVQLMHGRFGVHNGQNAVEAVDWLMNAQQFNSAMGNSNGN